jgi:hypothetical protein
MNTLKRFVWIGLAILGGVASATSTARAQGYGEPPIPAAKGWDNYRLTPISSHPGFSGNYIKDPTIMCPWNVRAEFSGQGWHSFERINIAKFDFMLSISLIENLEIGADMPLMLLQPDGNQPEHKGIGGISAYGKYRLLRLRVSDRDPGQRHGAVRHAAESALRDGLHQRRPQSVRFDPAQVR